MLMTDAGSAVAVLRMARVEPHVECKGLVPGLVLDELDASIDDEIGFVSQRSVWLLLVERIAPDGLELIEVIFPPKSARHLRVPLAEVTRAISRSAQEIGIETLHGLRTSEVAGAGRPITSAGQTGQDGRATDPANGMAHERVGKTCALIRQSINVRRLHEGMSVARERVGRLIIGKEEDDIGTIGRAKNQGHGRQQQ